MTTARAERTDLNVLRGMAGLYMVIHHLWARYPVPVSGLGRGLVELGSCAPVLFFFVTGAGYGLQGRRSGPIAGSTWKKAALLLCADQLLNFWRLLPIGIDFLGFIALSMILLEGVARLDRPVLAACTIAGAAAATRYVLGAQAVLGRLGLDGEGDVWFQVMVGATGVNGLSYPAGPWLVYPLLGFAVARTVPALGERRALLALAATLLGSTALTWLLARGGLVFFRWGTMSAAFFVLTFAVLSGSIALAVALARRPRLAAALSLRGVAAFVLVPLHYLCVELAAAVGRSPSSGAQLLLLGMTVALVAFAGSKRIALMIGRMSEWRRSRALYASACAVAALCGWLLIPARGEPLEPFWSVACMAAGQLALCALLVWRWEAVPEPAPRTAAPG